MKYDSKKLGIYQVGDFYTYRKFLAISEHRRTNKGVTWLFNNNEFDSYDWKACPDKSLQQLYIERAKQLRNDYEIIVLFYSGGSDSQTILDVFVDNNIFLDHIALCHSIKGDGDPHAYFNEEITKVAVPYLGSIESKINHTEVHIIDQTDAILNGFDNPDWWIDHANTLTPNCVTRSKIREWYLPFRELIDSGKKVGLIWGRDKPKLFSDQHGKYYTQFNDFVDNNTSAYSQSRSSLGWYDEFFFHDPQWPDIICRQSHEVIHRLSTRSINQKFFQTNISENGKCPYSEKYLTNQGINSIIYPMWNPYTFSNGKNYSQIWGARDQWFFDKKPEPAYSNWHKAIQYLDNFLTHSNRNHHWLSGSTIYHNVLGCVGPKYYLT